MAAFFEKRKLRKQVKECFHVARHARNMREDIADPADLTRLDEAVATLQEVIDAGGDAAPAMDKVLAASDKVYPVANMSGIRENVEVIIVALGAAMAIRAFFFQPYKIPTGSMQPTLNGIKTEEQAEASFFQRQPFKLFNWLLTGESYKVVRAKASGQLLGVRNDGNNIVVSIGGVSQKIPEYMWFPQLHERYFQKGDVIARAKAIAGDHILVNKMKYNFMKPQRGDISVFDTRHIAHEDIRKDTFYIKRMVGMPGETIQIKMTEPTRGRLMANNKPITDPPIFQKIDTDPNYSGHILATPNLGQKTYLAKPTDKLTLGDHEYLMMGDNTHSSLDGRYFGGVHLRDFQGPAFFVYWPFREHWGLVK